MNNVILIDQRVPSVPLGFLPHEKQVTCAAWNPIQSTGLATASDDQNLLIWSMDKIQNPHYLPH